MKTLIIFLISVLSISVYAQQNQDDNSSSDYIHQQPEIPAQFASKMDEYIFFDNNFNVVQRLRTQAKATENLMSAEDKQPVVVKIFVADLNSISKELFLSRFVENSDLEKVQTRKGQIFIPCLASNAVAMKLLNMKFGPPVYTTVGRKVLSRATYYIEPVGPTGGFFAKFVPNFPGFEEKLKREILGNDYIKSQLTQLPEDMRTLTMDSFLAVNLSFLGVPVSVAYRSANRILEDKPANFKTYPGHALLGCDICISEIAMQFTGNSLDQSKAIDRWKTKELLPKLARYMAYTNHVLGISLESHTQNMIFEIDHSTGQIAHIYFRDFADDLLSPLALLGENKLPQNIDWQKVKFFSVHGNLFADPDTQEFKLIYKNAKNIYQQNNYFSAQGIEAVNNLWQQIKKISSTENNESAELNNQARDIWYHASIYSGQGITSHITGFQRQQRHLLVFLKAYIAETENIIGEKVILSEDAERVLQQLEQKTERASFYSGELKGRSPLRNAMASVLKPIFEQVFRRQINMIQDRLKNAPTPPGQLELSKKMQHLISTQRVVFMSEEAKKQLSDPESSLSWYKKAAKAYFEFNPFKPRMSAAIVIKIQNNRMWAVESISGKVLAAAIDPLSPASPQQQAFTTRVQDRANVCFKIYGH